MFAKSRQNAVRVMDTEYLRGCCWSRTCSTASFASFFDPRVFMSRIVLAEVHFYSLVPCPCSPEHS